MQEFQGHRAESDIANPDSVSRLTAGSSIQGPHRIGDGSSPQTSPVSPGHVSPQRGVTTERRAGRRRGHRPRSHAHASPKRKREESATQPEQATRIPLLALRAWMEVPIPCKPEAQARGIRDTARQATRIPLLALRAWMGRGRSRRLRSGLLWARDWMDCTGALDTSIHMRTLVRRRQITCSPNQSAMNW
jgi:hypothetical protein